MLTSSHVFMTPLTPRHFSASWTPCGTFPFLSSCWWLWAGITLAAVPAALGLLKAGGRTHQLDASPRVSIKHWRLSDMERWRAKHSVIREPKTFDLQQSPALPLRTLYFKLCLLLPQFAFSWNPWLYGEGRRGLLCSVQRGFGAAASGRCRGRNKGNLLSELEIPTLCCQTCLFTGVEKGSWGEKKWIRKHFNWDYRHVVCCHLFSPSCSTVGL